MPLTVAMYLILMVFTIVFITSTVWIDEKVEDRRKKKKKKKKKGFCFTLTQDSTPF